MSSKPLEPRRVAPRAIVRWGAQALALIARAPLPFGCALLGAVLVDRFLAPHLATLWLTPIAALLYWPWFAAAILIARAADEEHRASAHLWATVLQVGVCVAALCAFLLWLPPGELTFSTAPSFWRLASLWGSLGFYATGAFLIPLIGFCRLPGWFALRASWLGHRRNQEPSLGLSALLGATTILLPLLLPPALAGLIPLFHGALSYVAYRDIFEARAQNAVPARALALVPVPIPAARRSGR